MTQRGKRFASAIGAGCVALVWLCVGIVSAAVAGVPEAPGDGGQPEGCAVEVALNATGAPLALAPVPNGPRTIIVMIVDFADATVSQSMSLPDPIGYVAGVMFDNARSSAGVLAEASFGLTTLDSDADGDGQHDIFNVSIDDTITDGSCLTGTWAIAADAAAVELGIDLGLYQHKMYVIPQVPGDCWWGGLAQVGCTATCRSWIRSKTATVYAHELRRGRKVTVVARMGLAGAVAA